MYLVKKGLEVPHPDKSRSEFYLTVEQLQAVLDKVREAERDADGVKNPKKRARLIARAKRDHAAIFLGYYLALRVGEAAICERDSLRHIDDGTIYVRTLKNLPRLPFVCEQCHRRTRVASGRIGQLHRCSACGHESHIEVPKRALDLNPPEKEPPVVERFVLEYAREYIRGLPADQRWLFEGHKGYHLSSQHLNRIFSTYTRGAGLSSKYSWHSLRHGRGLLIWETFKDHVMLRDSLRQKTVSAAEFYMHLSPQRRQEYADKLEGRAVRT